MFTATATGPSLGQLRPLKTARSRALDEDRYPVHADLHDRLLGHDPGTSSEADPTVAHALAVISAYAYAEVVDLGGVPNTLAAMVTRLGLPSSRVLMVEERIDAAFVVAAGFLVQSEDGRVALLAYRGTRPFDVASWMTDADLHNGTVTVRVGGADFPVHPGFYRNVRSIRSPLIEGLDRARRGLSIIDGSVVDSPMEALHLAGHSLGAAMAALQAVLLLNDPSYRPLGRLLRSVYGFGQPMIGGSDLARELEDSGQARRFQRFVYRRDVVPALPPIGLGDYAHFGAQYEVARSGGFVPSGRSVRQAPFVAIPIAAMQFVANRLPVVRHVPFLWSVDDHLPLNYVEWLAPVGCASEFGGYPAFPSR
jgi:hypothetical protein